MKVNKIYDKHFWKPIPGYPWARHSHLRVPWFWKPSRWLSYIGEFDFSNWMVSYFPTNGHAKYSFAKQTYSPDSHTTPLDMGWTPGPRPRVWADWSWAYPKLRFSQYHPLPMYNPFHVQLRPDLHNYGLYLNPTRLYQSPRSSLGRILGRYLLRISMGWGGQIGPDWQTWQQSSLHQMAPSKIRQSVILTVHFSTAIKVGHNIGRYHWS